MGNCLFSQGADDQSLLNESEGGSLPGELPQAAHQVSLCEWGGQPKSTPGIFGAAVFAPVNGFAIKQLQTQCR